MKTSRLGDFVKDIGLLFAYLMAYQIGVVFLQLPLVFESVPTVSEQVIEVATWIGLGIGIVLLTGLSFFLWKVVQKQKQVEYRSSQSWFHHPYLPVLALVGFIGFQLVFPTSPSQNQQTIILLTKSYPISMFFAVVVFAGVVEELLFRGLLGAYFFPDRMQAKTVILYFIVSGILFSLAHGPSTLPQFLIYFGMSLILTWSYLARSNLAHAMGLHMLNNALSFVMILFSV